MKIGLIVPGFGADERDWCIPAHLNLARSLASAHQVHVFALRYPHRRDLYTVYGVTVHSLNGESSQGLASAHLWTTALNSIRGEHDKSRFDVLHSIYGGEAGFVTVVASRLLRVPGVVSLVGGELAGLKDIGYGQDLRWRQRLMNQIALRYADRILCGSRRMTELARARLSATDRERIQTLPLGIDTDMFSPSPSSPSGNGQEQSVSRSPSISNEESEEGIKILNVGSLIPVKDHVTLLRAMAELLRDRPNARLAIIGKGVMDRQLRTLAADLHIAHRIDFVGSVVHDQLPKWYRRADLFVQSSRHEGEGIAVLEAAASGLALVGTEVGVLSDLAAQGAAIAVPPKDASALAGAMRQALASPVALGTRAREIALSDYNLERIGERLVKVYCSTQAQTW